MLSLLLRWQKLYSMLLELNGEEENMVILLELQMKRCGLLLIGLVRRPILILNSCMLSGIMNLNTSNPNWLNIITLVVLLVVMMLQCDSQMATATICHLMDQKTSLLMMLGILIDAMEFLDFLSCAILQML